MTTEEINQLNEWSRPIQQALTIEVDHGYKNIFGRGEHFNEFLSRKLKEPPLLPFPSEVYEMLNKLSIQFDKYPASQESLRRRLIIDSRKFLHKLSHNFATPSSFSPPRLNIQSENESKDKTTISVYNNLSLDSSLECLRGIGSKTTEKLSSLGLVTVKDLFLYYPRDYIDYTSLSRINSLNPGETSTIVATVRRCNSFTSPKNPNLSILELHLQDCTGRIKATKFFTGRRQSNIGFLKTLKVLEQ